MYLFYVYVYVLYELFFIDNVVRMLFYVNMCACHVYFTITLLTYLLTTIDSTLLVQFARLAVLSGKRHPEQGRSYGS